jgi:hypothetical protein
MDTSGLLTVKSFASLAVGLMFLVMIMTMLSNVVSSTDGQMGYAFFDQMMIWIGLALFALPGAMIYVYRALNGH